MKLPLALRPVDWVQLPHKEEKFQSPFCSLMGHNSRSCLACLEAQNRVISASKDGPRTLVCFAGIAEAAIPIKVGEKLAGFIQTGQVFLKEPSSKDFARVTRQLVEWGLKENLSKYEEAFFHTRVLDKAQFQSLIKLVSIFAQHLSIVSNQLLVQETSAEPPAIARAKQFICENQSQDISLAEVAKVANTSTYYFCKIFKKTTGLHFTDYLARVRIEKAKNLLVNPNLRVSEVAYEVGFQSLTHFNRVFRKMSGQTPSDYRERLPHATSGGPP